MCVSHDVLRRDALVEVAETEALDMLLRTSTQHAQTSLAAAWPEQRQLYCQYSYHRMYLSRSAASKRCCIRQDQRENEDAPGQS
jgi:hypothetical protein